MKYWYFHFSELWLCGVPPCVDCFENTYLLQNTIKTNEILTFSFLRSVHRPKAAAIQNEENTWKKTPLQNSVKTNEILTFPSLRIRFQWCSHSLTFSRMAQGETPLGQFSVFETCSSGVSPFVDCVSYGLGWDATGAILCFRKMPQWCLTFGWLFLVWYSTYVFNSWVWLHIGTSIVGIPCNEVSWSYRAGKLGLGWILLSDRAPSFPPEGVWSSIPSVTPCWLKSGSPRN